MLSLDSAELVAGREIPAANENAIKAQTALTDLMAFSLATGIIGNAL